MAGNTIRPLFGVVRRQFEGVQVRLLVGLTLVRLLPTYAFAGIRLRLLRLAGIAAGDGTGIGGRMWVGGGPEAASRLTLGARCFVNDGCRFDTYAPITIGDDVHLGHDVAVLTATHHLGDAGLRAGPTTGGPISIERGSWIGARATILAGVTIGAGSVVAAGAVVDRSVAPCTLVGGVPARPIRELVP
jgi:acetyltransferase-like isoleucine patch superfamily enzyme